MALSAVSPDDEDDDDAGGDRWISGRRSAGAGLRAGDGGGAIMSPSLEPDRRATGAVGAVGAIGAGEDLSTDRMALAAVTFGLRGRFFGGCFSVYSIQQTAVSERKIESDRSRVIVLPSSCFTDAARTDAADSAAAAAPAAAVAATDATLRRRRCLSEGIDAALSSIALH